MLCKKFIMANLTAANTEISDTNVLYRYVKDAPATPIGPNYQNGKKLMAEEYLAANNEIECAFNFSEAVSASLRTLAVYRDEQIKISGTKNIVEKLRKCMLKPVQHVADKYENTITKEETDTINSLFDEQNNKGVCDTAEESLPFYERYLRFSKDNNANNFLRILKELPEEWTIIQLTAPYNPNENIKPLNEYSTEINSLYLSVFTNNYLENCDLGPITINIPANFKEGERPLFNEIYSVLQDNYDTIDKAPALNNTRLVHNYWSKREDIDLRMKGVISSMDRDWLAGWSCLLTGKLVDKKLKEKIVRFVDDTIADWGFIKLTTKQRYFLYNLFDGCSNLTPTQIKYCIRSILTERGDPENVREVLKAADIKCCSTDFSFLNELCFKCQAKGFEEINKFTVVDGIRAFSKAATQIMESDEWAKLKKAKRFPVILIVDELLDTFPWESLPILNYHPISRMENIHFIYYLYKIHETSCVNGYFIANSGVGRYVINPEKNLERMEKRMSSFVNYWCRNWSGHIGETPSPDQYLKHLNEADIFLYCGHGDGCSLGAGGAGGGVEGARGRRVALLSGCGSVRLARAPGRAAPSAPHHHLHIAASPLVIGMLWEVTDLEVDKVVSTLVSLCVPSDANPAWPSVGKTNWSKGVLDTNVEQKTKFVPEYDILKAVSRARSSTNFVMIASSVVSRGLPVRIQKD